MISQSPDNPYVFTQGVAVDRTPTDEAVSVHATTIDSSVTWTCCKYYTTITSPTPPPITTFDSYLATLDDWRTSILERIHFYEPIHSIAQYIA
eukprot:2443086-Ditylum_brightwellii.AAC.7